MITRTEWGADESWMKWTPQYVRPHIVIHHTTHKSEGGVELIQGTYRYHALTLGWGDIGYHFLINQGYVYEGRFGGDYVIGGHALGYNNGGIGIAVVGDYSINEPSEKDIQAVISLCVDLCEKFSIVPTTTIDKSGLERQVISGHRDYNDTSCPGDNLYKHLSAIRSEVMWQL